MKMSLVIIWKDKQMIDRFEKNWNEWQNYGSFGNSKKQLAEQKWTQVFLPEGTPSWEVG